MNATNSVTEAMLIEQALRAASHTRLLIASEGVRHEAASAFASQFGDQAAVIVADQNTFAAAGKDVAESFARAGRATSPPFIFGSHVDADDRDARELQLAIEPGQAIPIAVGSGIINDLTKLAAHRLNRPYMVVATAASMDGYTAYGASITSHGSKQTFDCPAPRAVLADLEVIAKAPRGMNASGYADLLAKVAAGADWIVADALGVEPIVPDVWNTVQKLLPEWVAAPAEIARAEPAALRRLVNGLMMSGFAMQAARSSRPASGADHQFSHLWDMQHHTHDGIAPSHGFKVGIGTLASISLHEELLGRDLSKLNVEATVANWPTLAALQAEIQSLFGAGELADKAALEMEAKYLPPAAVQQQLLRLREVWPELQGKLTRHLLPLSQVRSMLQTAGCPCEPEQIGISRQRLRQSYRQALFIRRRFTVLDLAHRTGLFDDCLDSLFEPAGA